MEELFGSEPLMTKTGTILPSEAFKECKIVGLYFSMHNCPPCRDFTPIFAELYKEMNADGKVIEVVFLSGDKTQEQFDEYYGEMPWIALPRGDARLANIAKKYEVKGVPRLVIVKPDGTMIDNSAVQKVTMEGPGAMEEYLSK
jgi:nucleoredoxin